MDRITELNKQNLVQRWRIRTGNMTFKGSHRDGKTIEAEARMKRKPYHMKGKDNVQDIS